MFECREDAKTNERPLVARDVDTAKRALKEKEKEHDLQTLVLVLASSFSLIRTPRVLGTNDGE